MSEPLGILLMAMGGPDSLEAVGPYLQDVRGGRPTPPELVEEITARYRVTGGKSPVLGITRALAQGLVERLQAAGLPGAKAYVGLRHWHPYIRETYQDVMKDGVGRLIGVCMAPQNSRMSVGAYIRKVEEAQKESGAPMKFTYVASWNTHPTLIQALADNIQEALRKFPAEGRERVPILFTAHSLPERILAEDDPYPREVRETVDALLAVLQPRTWRFAYQSQGRSSEPWLGPTVEATLDELSRLGHRTVLMAPVGFVSDHVEILYDIDIEFKQYASQRGMQLERMAMLNASAPLVETLADVVLSHLKKTGP